jgi:hypothetical protein
MDKNGARGRALSVASYLLRSTVFIDEASKSANLTQEELAMVKQELKAISSEHARIALLYKAIETDTYTDQKGVNPAGDEVCLYINDGNYINDEEDIHSVTLRTHGMSINLEVSTPEDALKLYEALLKVKEVEAD